MRERIEALALEGRTVRVTARDPLPVEPRVLALAAAMRVFERYPVLHRLTLTVAGAEVTASREEVERLLGPEGFSALKDRDRWRRLLAEGLQEAPQEETG